MFGDPTICYSYILFCNILFTGAVVATTAGKKNSKFVTLLDYEDDYVVYENRELEQNRSLVQADRHSLVGKQKMLLYYYNLLIFIQFLLNRVVKAPPRCLHVSYKDQFHENFHLKLHIFICFIN